MAQPISEQTSSCISKEPFIKLGSGTAPELNYNLPQSSCFSVNAPAELEIPEDYFKPECFQEPPSHFWNQTLNQGEMQIRQDLQDQLMGVSGPSVISGFRTKAFKPSLFQLKKGLPGSLLDGKMDAGTNSNLLDDKLELGGGDLDNLVEQVQRGRRPIATRTFFGDREIKFFPKPEKPTPAIYVVLEYKVCSYLGEYGAGKTLNTLSLLPGEKTTITVRTFKHNESVRTKAENILDSFSKESSEEFEQSLQEEAKTFGSESFVKNSGWSVGGDVSFPIKKVVKVNLSGGYSQNKTLSELAESTEISIENTLNRTVSNSSELREVTVNSTSSQTAISESEELISRELENINKSRVLNFVFRQLLQEYVTLTYLNDVRIVYSNGFPEDFRSERLNGMDDLLSSVLADQTKVEEVRNDIILQLCNLYDHTGTRRSFIEKVDDSIQDCAGVQVGTISYYRKQKDLKDAYQNGNFSIEVPGILKSVSSRVIRTESVVADALLGQGEALDCYNQRLQDAAALKALLENDRLAQQITSLDAIADPVQRAELYKRVFGECCDVAQTQVIN